MRATPWLGFGPSGIASFYPIAWSICAALAHDTLELPNGSQSVFDESQGALRTQTSHILDHSRLWEGIGRMPDQLQPVFGVSLPVDNPTKSFWLNTPGVNPLAEVGSTGELTQEADVCIIGSGITGISTAWHLSNGSEKPSIAIFEAREFCACFVYFLCVSV